MSFIVVIPARYASTRLPGKPLLDIVGKPMIQHVYERARSSSAERVIVATDDRRIEAVVEGFGGEVVMTSDQHPSGTDRLEEVARKLDLATDSIIVNLQGDEPLLSVNAIEQVAGNLQKNIDCGIATLCELIVNDEELSNPNVVKVVRCNQGRALYFSRSTIPFPRDKKLCASRGLWYRHIGLYAYRVDVLKRFVKWEPSTLETSESLEQLRALQNGVSIHCDTVCEPIPGGVDTPEDLERIRSIMKNTTA